ncbi:hypothetical protein [Candidatus Phytoplasma sp. AldY-WA1]|uniref:hypothetical protein n=1 Tax=Candidatus Phytoplasma sp. AldY-WA1 TaxID=2852100 RepID=UPI00254CD227|nr:hypothetical protein [Candidatus Phytoplasma sp. AldY-WA1]
MLIRLYSYFVNKMNVALRNPELFAIAIKHGYYIPALRATEIKGTSDKNNPNGNLETLDDKLKTTVINPI